jgi:hypothetical protein
LVSPSASEMDIALVRMFEELGIDRLTRLEAIDNTM